MQAEQAEIVETPQFCATVGKNRGLGSTPGEALSNLLKHLGDVVPTPIVIWPYNRGDEYWSDAQQQRLLDLRSRMETLTASEREEWERLVEMSFDAYTLVPQAAIAHTIISHCPVLPAMGSSRMSSLDGMK